MPPFETSARGGVPQGRPWLGRLVRGGLGGVLLWGVLGCAWRVGRQPGLGPVSWGGVLGHAVEPGVEEALAQGSAQAVALYGGFGEGRSLTMTVVSTTVTPIAGDGSRFEASLTVQAQVEGCPAVVRAGRAPLEGSMDPVALSEARARALASLARDLAEQSVGEALIMACPGGLETQTLAPATDPGESQRR